MRLDAEVAFEGISALMRKMGAQQVIWEPAPPIDINDLEIDIEDVSPKTRIEIESHLFEYPHGLFGVGKRQCLLYIPYISDPKFHFMACNTIKRMKREGRFERYVITFKTSGLFTVYVSA